MSPGVSAHSISIQYFISKLSNHSFDFIEKPHRNSPNIFYNHAPRKESDKERLKFEIPKVDVKKYNKPAVEPPQTEFPDGIERIEIKSIKKIEKSPKK